MPESLSPPGARSIAVVLAAGGSTRMGSPKPLLPLHGRPWILWHADRLATLCERVWVVTGADADRVRSALPEAVATVHNPRWRESWPVDSLRLALAAAGWPAEAWVTPVDVAPAHPSTLAALRASPGAAVPVDRAGNPGHPVRIDAGIIERLRGSVPDGGLRALLTHAARVPVSDPWAADDFDHPEDFDAFARAWRPEDTTKKTSG